VAAPFTVVLRCVCNVSLRHTLHVSVGFSHSLTLLLSWSYVSVCIIFCDCFQWYPRYIIVCHYTSQCVIRTNISKANRRTWMVVVILPAFKKWILTRALAHLWLFSAFMWYSMYFVSNTKTFNVIVLQFSASNVGNSVCIYIIVGVNHGEDARDVYPLRYWSWYSYDTRPRFWNFWHVM